MRRAILVAIRAWHKLWGHICEVAGLLVCLVLIVLFLPLIPVFRMFEGMQRLLDEEEK